MSEGFAFNLATKYVTIECCNCHVVFAVSQELRNELIQSRRSFFCPRGHSQNYVGKSDVEKAREEAAEQRKNAEWWQRRANTKEAEAKMAGYRERAQKAAKTRLKNRIAAGVCPCCTRSFENLQRHMKNQHPEFSSREAQ